jgi:hypothetical protein
MSTRDIDPSDALEVVLAVDRGDDPLYELDAFVDAVLGFATNATKNFA